METVRSFEYDDDGKLLRAVENEEQQGQYIYTYQYDDMGNRTFYSKTRNGAVQESAEYTYNVSNRSNVPRFTTVKRTPPSTILTMPTET